MKSQVRRSECKLSPAACRIYSEGEPRSQEPIANREEVMSFRSTRYQIMDDYCQGLGTIYVPELFMVDLNE